MWPSVPCSISRRSNPNDAATNFQRSLSNKIDHDHDGLRGGEIAPVPAQFPDLRVRPKYPLSSPEKFIRLSPVILHFLSFVATTAAIVVAAAVTLSQEFAPSLGLDLGLDRVGANAHCQVNTGGRDVQDPAEMTVAPDDCWWYVLHRGLRRKDGAQNRQKSLAP